MSDVAKPADPAHAHHPADAQHGPGGGHHDHIVPLWILVAVIVALLVLTVVTVAVAIATPNVFLAVFIATIKASLVCLFFMHLYWDKPFNSVMFLISVGLLGLFLWFAMLDTGQYQHTVQPAFSEEGMKRRRALQGTAEEAQGGGH